MTTTRVPLALLTSLLLFEAASTASDWPMPIATGEWKQWRGPDRANRSPETGLMREWPEGGPPLEWQTEGLGDGIASLSIADGHIYTMTYAHEKEWIVALRQATGELAWGTQVGPAVEENPLMRWLSQRTPTLDDDRLYALTGHGELVCLSTDDGRELWRKSYVRDFQTRSGIWGFGDFPLVDGDRLICTPGGTENTIVALNKFTGDIVWKTKVESADEDDVDHAYAAVMVIEAGGVRQYISRLQGMLVGIAAADGRLLWTYDRFRSDFGSVTPIVLDEQVFYSGRPRSRAAVLLTLVPQDLDQNPAFAAREAYYTDLSLDVFQDSLVRDGD